MHWRDKLLGTWVVLEMKGLKRLGYKCYAVGAVFYSFYRLRIFQPIITHLYAYARVVHATIMGSIKLLK